MVAVVPALFTSAGKQGQGLPVCGVGKACELVGLKALILRLAPAAVLLGMARRNLDDQTLRGQGARDIDEVHNLVAGLQRRALLGLAHHVGAQVLQGPFPRFVRLAPCLSAPWGNAVGPVVVKAFVEIVLELFIGIGHHEVLRRQTGVAAQMVLGLGSPQSRPDVLADLELLRATPAVAPGRNPLAVLPGRCDAVGRRSYLDGRLNGPGIGLIDPHRPRSKIILAKRPNLPGHVVIDRRSQPHATLLCLLVLHTNSL